MYWQMEPLAQRRVQRKLMLLAIHMLRNYRLSTNQPEFHPIALSHFLHSTTSESTGR